MFYHTQLVAQGVRCLSMGIVAGCSRVRWVERPRTQADWGMTHDAPRPLGLR